MKKSSTSGQSILEYTLLLGVVITVIVLVLLGPVTGIGINPGGPPIHTGGVKGAVQKAYTRANQAINNTTANLKGGIFGP